MDSAEGKSDPGEWFRQSMELLETKTESVMDDASGQRQRLSSWMPGKLSECPQWLEEIAAGGLGESQSSSSGPDFDIPGYLHKEIMKLTVHSAAELESVWAQVGSQTTTDAKMRVVNQMIAAIRGACEACVKQERDTRDNIIAYIAEAKHKILDLHRRLGLRIPPEDELDDTFFYGEEKMETLLDQLATLEMTMEGLETKERQQRQVVEELLKQMATINNNMDRTPEAEESEPSGGPEWDEKGGWELSDERVARLRKGLVRLNGLKEQRGNDMVELVVSCQKLFVQLGLACTNPLQTKMMMSLDPSSPVDRPTLRTEEQTQTSVGLSAFNVERLTKLKCDMEEDRALHLRRKEEQEHEIRILWDKLGVPEDHRQAVLASTTGITHAAMEHLDTELARAKRLKAEKLNDMIEAAREEIFHLLEGVGARAEEVLKQSARDLHVAREDWTEELLERLEEFLVMLGGMRERASKIAANVQKRGRLVEVREKLDNSKMDYRARGGTALQNQAKVIDSMKKELKKLPAVTDELRKMLKEWQSSEGFPFRYKGREYLKVIEESDAMWQRKKEVNRRAKMYGGGEALPVSPGLSRRGGGSGSSSGGSSVGGGNASSTTTSLSGDSVPAPTSPSRLTPLHGSVFNTTGGGGGGFQRPNSVRLGSGGLFGTSGTAVVSDGSKVEVGGVSGILGRIARFENGANGGAGVGVGGGSMVDGRDIGFDGEGGVAKNEGSKDSELLMTPRKESRNPLLTPSALKGLKSRNFPGVFASTGGSLRQPPPPLPERPTSLRLPQAISRIQSAAALARGAFSAQSSPVNSVHGRSALVGLGHDGISADDGDGVKGTIVRAGPPPLPDRPSRPLDGADLTSIRESTASLRSSASASDVLSAGRETDASMVTTLEGGE